MRRIAVTGHRGLPDGVGRRVDAEIRAYLDTVPGPIVGLSCLADGADTLFAQAILDRDGRLEVLVPARSYRDSLPAEHHDRYDALLERASTVRRFPAVSSTAESHMRASRYMIDHADEVLAVWDGRPARGYGGTADVVAYARERGRPCTIVWPPGTYRD